MRAPVLVVDVGSTFTKGLLVDADGAILGGDARPTTLDTDVLDGVDEVRAALAPGLADDALLVCSSAGGGLRLAVVGYEERVTAEAGRRVGLSAGAKVVHVAAGPLDGDGVRTLRAARPDVVLLVGGTDGGNREVLEHNAARLACARITAPVVVAGNADAADTCAAELAGTGRRFVVCANVLPRIGVVEPAAARAAIREVFLEHVIGGKGLSRGSRFGRLVRAATPDAVLAGVECLARVAGHDVLVVDVGGATTDVYSVIEPQGEDATLRKEVVAPLWAMRTVEGDLGMRWSAATVLDAAEREQLAVAPGLAAHVDRVSARPGTVPASEDEQRLDAELARLCALVAVRRHARPDRPMLDIGLVLGSGGALREGGDATRGAVLGGILGDHAGGWKVPRAATAGVDGRYVLAAAGLLALAGDERAETLARTLVPA